MESQKVERDNCQDYEAYKFLPLFIRQKDVVTYVLERKDLLVPFLNPTTFLKIFYNS